MLSIHRIVLRWVWKKGGAILFEGGAPCAGSFESTEWFKKGMSMSRPMHNARAFWGVNSLRYLHHQRSLEARDWFRNTFMYVLGSLGPTSNCVPTVDYWLGEDPETPLQPPNSDGSTFQADCHLSRSRLCFLLFCPTNLVERRAEGYAEALKP